MEKKEEKENYFYDQGAFDVADSWNIKTSPVN